MSFVTPTENIHILSKCGFEMKCDLQEGEFCSAIMDLSVCRGFNYAAAYRG